MTREQECLVERAQEALDAASYLLDGGYIGIAAGRAYYSMFHAAEAYLLEFDLEFKTHSAVIGAFHHRLVQESAMPRELPAWLADASVLRLHGDYGGEQIVTPEDAKTTIERAERFLAAIRSRLAG